MRRATTLLFAFALVVLNCGTGRVLGAIAIAGPAAANHTPALVLADGDRVDLNPDPVLYLGAATAAMRARLAAEFPAWNFAYAVGGLAGVLTINQYRATSAGPHNGGGLLEATYTRAAGDPAIANLHWIQMVDTNRPLGGAGNPYIDPRPNDDTLPFYWTLAEDAQAANGDKTAATYHFFDNSRRNCAGHPDFITWRGELMLASWDGNDPGNVTVYDGVRWGWDFRCVGGVVAVPEPGTFLACALGSIGLAAVRLGRRPGRPRLAA